MSKLLIFVIGAIVGAFLASIFLMLIGMSMLNKKKAEELEKIREEKNHG